MDTEHTGTEAQALDAYSRVVTGVAASVLPSVAALAVRTARGAGAGSAVTFTDDGFLLTSAHVVQGANSGTATFAVGAEAGFDVVGAVPLSDLGVLPLSKDSWARRLGHHRPMKSLFSLFCATP